MTNGWTDIRNADVVVAMGGNPAENHPVGFRFVMEAKRNRNAKLICVDPRFNRTSAGTGANRSTSDACLAPRASQRPKAIPTNQEMRSLANSTTSSWRRIP